MCDRRVITDRSYATWHDEEHWIKIAMQTARRCGGHEVHPIFNQCTCYKNNLSEALRLIRPFICRVIMVRINRDRWTSQIIKTHPERSMKIRRTPFRAFYNASTPGLISRVRSRSDGQDLSVAIHSPAVSSGPLIELNAPIGRFFLFRPIK